MTALDIPAAHTAPAIRVPNLLAAVARGWADLRRRQAERASIVRISRMAPHLIRDMGFDPDAIYDALEGSWDELTPDHVRLR